MIIRVQIESMDDEGRGRASHCDSRGQLFSVAVRGAFVGDDVLLEVERIFPKEKLKTGRALKFLKQGDCHVKRVCSHQGPCPACPLHGFKEELALELKKSRIERALAKHNLNYRVEDVLPHAQIFGYRQKVKLVSHVEDGKLNLGLYIPASHNFAPADACPYVHPDINRALAAILSIINVSTKAEDLAPIKALIVRLGKNGLAAILVASEPLSHDLFALFSSFVDQGLLLSFAERLQDAPTNSLISGVVNRRLGPMLIEPLEGGPALDADSFCQSDPIQANIMYDLVADFLTAETKLGAFIDAYAGSGGFAQALKRKGAEKIIAIEESSKSEASLSEIGVSVMIEPMSSALKNLGPEEVAGMVVDPPKKGLGADALPIAKLKAKRLALVSCDPEAMAKDLKLFVEHGYEVKRIIPIDFFGGTPGIETVVLLRRCP